MKRRGLIIQIRAFIILFVTVSSFHLYSQSINAGVHTVGDYYYDFTPNTVLLAIDSMNPNGDTVHLDLNGDNIMDYRIEAVCSCMTHWYHFKHYKIVPLNSNLIAIEYYDSCYANLPPDSAIYTKAMVLPINQNDVIDNSLNWINTTGYLAYGGWNCCTPNSYGHSCSLSSFGQQPKYIGVKLNAIGGPYFGWISIQQLDGDTLEVNDFASNYFPIGLDDYTTSSIRIFPNPVNDEMHIILPAESNETQISIYNLSGVDMAKYTTTSKTQIDLNVSSWPAGMYFIHFIIDGNVCETKKMIKE